MTNRRELIITIFLLFVLLSLFFFVFKPSSKISVVPTVSPTVAPTGQEIKEIHFTEEELKNYYSSYENPFILHIRKALNGYLAGTNEGIDGGIVPYTSESGTVGGLDSFSKDYYKSKFIVFAINNGVMGGWIINIVFQDKPDKLFNVWVYKLNEDNYVFRGFWQNNEFTDEEMEKIQKEYKIYLDDKQHAL